MRYNCLYGINTKLIPSVVKLEEVIPNIEKRIREIELKIFRIKEFKKSTKDISNAFNQLVKELNDFSDGIISQHDIESKVSTSIKSYLTQIKTYLDSTPHLLKKYISEYPKYEEIFKSATHYEYDNNFHYRFILQYRNYSQHCDKVYQKVKKNLQNGKLQIKFSINNKFFVENFKAMKPELKKELLLNPESDIDIIEQIQLMNNSIKTIHVKIINALTTKELYEDALYLYKIKERYSKFDMFMIMDEKEFKSASKIGNQTFNTNIIDVGTAYAIIKYYNENQSSEHK